ncbi:PEP-utilizing enzyme [Paenibacillus residui]|uniref:PEP-utilizing enzyme n=1 Tax=Paenibacillus residui TaxID=629724 RepID=A0ABW3D9M5_9BACL
MSCRRTAYSTHNTSGGILSHSAIIAHEYRIPLVVATVRS